ncbi:hypothetical protein ASE14_15355 [Agromyces sp. Root81]|nr:hypothetical protein ASE14_15355 [Agromyces sp. Root81]
MAEAAAAAKSEKTAAEKAEADRLAVFGDAVKRCGLHGKVEIADNGGTLIVDGAGEDLGSGEVDFGELDCIIDAVDTPTSVSSKMYETRSLDGRQEGEWDGVKASWSYHPDDGLDIIFELVD